MNWAGFGDGLVCRGDAPGFGGFTEDTASSKFVGAHLKHRKTQIGFGGAIQKLPAELVVSTTGSGPPVPWLMLPCSLFGPIGSCALHGAKATLVLF